jgi:hypothetical protein
MVVGFTLLRHSRLRLLSAFAFCKIRIQVLRGSIRKIAPVVGMV